jgi:NAD(P)H-hydrate epimerase
LDGAAGVIDALLGTGFSGKVREPLRSIIIAVNESALPVIAVDIPSGVNASNGEVSDVAIHASATATFHRAKPGLWIAPGKQYTGDVHVIPIGIPADAPVSVNTGLITESVLSEIPDRLPNSTKFDSGNVIVLGGSIGLTGAPSMAALAAMRSGAGYVTACVPASLNLVFEQRLLETMTVPLPDSNGALLAEASSEVLTLTQRRGGALVLGPGLGREPQALQLARDVATQVPQPLVLDADGLNAHAGELECLAKRSAPTVLTPHGGELARLLEVDSSAVNAQRLKHATEAAAKSNAVIVLKGDDTLVVSPQGMVAVSPGEAPGLATAGTGDVLSGVVGTLLAKGLDPFTAASAAVYAHQLAGQIAARRLGGPDCVIASDVITSLPAAFAR